MGTVQMKTKTKLTIARSLSRVVRTGRHIWGRGNIVTCRRSGLRWELDLAEGIDLSIYCFGTFEPEIVGFASRVVRQNGTVIDIGANIGAHTLRFAELVGPHGKVFAFEPTDYAFSKLTRNIALNPDLVPRIHAFQALLAASSDQAKPNGICSSWPLESTGTVHAVHMGEAKSLQGACVTTLDDVARQLVWKAIDLVKLDVDGNELFVLQGARTFLTENHPPILIEFAPYLYAEFGYSLRDLSGLLASMGYQCQLLPAQRRVDFDRLPEIIGDGRSINVLLV